MTNRILLNGKASSHLDVVNRNVIDKYLVGVLSDGQECWRGMIKLNHNFITVETIGSSENKTWYGLYAQFQRWKKLVSNGSFVHEEDWNHYLPDSLTSEVILERLRK